MQPLRVTGSRREAVPVKKGCWIGKKKKKRVQCSRKAECLVNRITPEHFYACI